jgi:hypothetical protein
MTGENLQSQTDPAPLAPSEAFATGVTRRIARLGDGFTVPMAEAIADVLGIQVADLLPETFTYSGRVE